MRIIKMSIKYSLTIDRNMHPEMKKIYILKNTSMKAVWGPCNWIQVKDNPQHYKCPSQRSFIVLMN